MDDHQLVVACDFGSTEFRALVCEVPQDGRLRVAGCGRLAAIGFEDGDFVDLRSGCRAIAQLMKEAERSASVDISAFFYNIAGSHLRSVWATGQVPVGPAPRPVSEDDLAAVLTRARSLVIPFDNWILALNPVDYTVDRVRGIVDPLGRIGSQLEVEAHLITGSTSVVRNVENAIKTAGYEVAGRAVDILAAATALLRPEERQAGVLLVDIGGRATNWAMLRHDRIMGNGIVPWGGCALTADLAHGLRIDAVEAERIKVDRGVVLRSLVPETSTDLLFEEEDPEETPGLVAAILEPRMEEILSLVKRDVGDPGRLESLGAGLVLTGGGARCLGTARLAEQVFGQRTRKRFLPEHLDLDTDLDEAQWATAIGLCIWAAGEQAGGRAADDGRSRGGRSLRERIRDWFVS